MVSRPNDYSSFRTAVPERSFTPYLLPSMAMEDLRDLESFNAHTAALEARIAAAEAAGEEVPVEARLMLASLRDLAQAVEGLRSSVEEPDNAGGEPDGDEAR